MIRIYLAACTKADEHEIGRRLAEYALRCTFGVRADIAHDERGKPIVSGAAQLHVSISHSGERCLAAVSDSPIGADIEYRRPGGERLLRLARRFFTADELAYVRHDPELRFYEIWTAKESFIKYTGEGLSRPLPSFSVLDSELCFTHFTYENYAAAVCSAEDAGAVEPEFIRNITED